MRALLSVRARRAAGAADRSRGVLRRDRQRRPPPHPARDRADLARRARGLQGQREPQAASRRRRRGGVPASQHPAGRGGARHGGAARPRCRTLIAGKTGTSDEFNDAWFIGFSNDVTIAIWTGYDNTTMKTRRRSATAMPARAWRCRSSSDHEGGLGRLRAAGRAAGAVARSQPPADRAADRRAVGPADRIRGDRTAFVEYFRLDESGRLDEIAVPAGRRAAGTIRSATTTAGGAAATTARSSSRPGSSETSKARRATPASATTASTARRSTGGLRRGSMCRAAAGRAPTSPSSTTGAAAVRSAAADRSAAAAGSSAAASGF